MFDPPPVVALSEQPAQSRKVLAVTAIGGRPIIPRTVEGKPTDLSEYEGFVLMGCCNWAQDTYMPADVFFDTYMPTRKLFQGVPRG